jgi:four helix bundle protein
VGVNRFEDLRVWQAAKQQCDQVGTLLRHSVLERDPGLADQLNRASVSVGLNITEGFLRRRDKETKQFLRYAIASNGELKACDYIAEGRGYLAAASTAGLVDQNDRIARMLRRWYATLSGKD